MTAIINASSVNGVTITSDTSGSMAFQSNGTTVATVSSTGLQISTYNPATSLITSGTAQTVSGVAAVNFTGIPSWVKRITVQFYNVSQTGGTSPYLSMRIGSGSIDTTSYLSQLGTVLSSSASSTGSTTYWYLVNPGSTASAWAGHVVLTNISGTNNWIFNSVISSYNDARAMTSAGSHTTSSTLDRIQLLCSDGTTTFSGTFNILYE